MEFSDKRQTALILFWFLYLHLGESKDNIALNKPAYQSSTLANYYNPVAGKALDGNNNSDFTQASCSHTTGYEVNPWWVVDLEESYNIAEVVITNRGDCCGERLLNVWIGVGFSFDRNIGLKKELFATFAQHKGQGKNGETLKLTSCKNNNSGQYLAITVDSNILSLCEVEVYCHTSVTDSHFRIGKAIMKSKNHAISTLPCKTINVQGETPVKCTMHCSKEIFCKAFNYYKKNGFVICELHSLKDSALLEYNSEGSYYEMRET